MTSIFDRYMFRQAAGALTLILLSLSGVVWIALALRQLNVVTSGGQDTVQFLLMTTLALPNLMVLIAPVALLIALIHTLTRLNGDSELIVLTASGAHMWSVARPLLVLALVVSLAVSAVNHVFGSLVAFVKLDSGFHVPFDDLAVQEQRGVSIALAVKRSVEWAKADFNVSYHG